MNVLVITPDAVGSTLLQRMLTIYMQFHKFDQPVINLHELTNGLARYYSPEFNRELVSKHSVQKWGYYQTLQEIAELLDSVDHYKTSRLAHYHIQRRGDTLAQQIPFYRYLNDNFYIIACRRHNVFEHALSMTLSQITKKLNVYDVPEKIDTFYSIYQGGIELDTAVFVKRLDDYRRYLTWSEQYFTVSRYFNYEQDVPRLEQYILDLPVFGSQSNRITWEQNFGISFNDWNRFHWVRSDLYTAITHQQSELPRLIANQVDAVTDYQRHALPDWPAVYSSTDIETLPPQILQQWQISVLQRRGIVGLLSPDKQAILQRYQPGYDQAQKTIQQMIHLGIMVNGPPIKKQTLKEKRKIITNFAQLIDLYNQWLEHNPGIAEPVDEQALGESVDTELTFWNQLFRSAVSQPVALSNQQ
jgi:hypothetical protein